ncbi:hypothetical protein [Nocardia sp. NPDC057455]|uniref:hypothetical protein n=1 Tax=Nocardia sp. NPDC057455 TaxID=3346138 RepID=UPI003672E63D
MAAKPTRVRTWTRPIVVVTLLMALLSVMYLGYVVDPEENSRIRAILYCEASGAAGLERGVWMALLGLCFGAAVTIFYDREGLWRVADRGRGVET